MSQDQDWRITPKQELFIHGRIHSLSKKEGVILIELIEGLFRSRPSSKNLQDNSPKIGTLEPSTQLGDP